MNDKFPLWLQRVFAKLRFLAIPNLGGVLAGLAVLGFVAFWIQPIQMERFLFDPQRVLEGEWYRLFSFPFTGGMTNPIFLLFYVLYVYFVAGALESTWGAGPLTLYVFLGYVCALCMAFFTGHTLDISFFILEYLTLAFGTLYPDYELNLYGIIPVKAKWFAVLAAVMIGWQFITLLELGWWQAAGLPLAFTPYLIFFGPLLVREIRQRRRVSQNRKRFHGDMWR